MSVKRPQEKKDSRRHRKLGRLKGEKKAPRRRWKVANEGERRTLRPMGGREETSEGLAPRRKRETEEIREEESYEKLF